MNNWGKDGGGRCREVQRRWRGHDGRRRTHDDPSRRVVCTMASWRDPPQWNVSHGASAFSLSPPSGASATGTNTLSSLLPPSLPFFFLSQKKKKGHALNLWYESSRLQRSRPVGVIQQHRRRNKKNRYLQWCWTRYIASLLKAWWAHFFFKEEGKIKFKKRKGL